MFKKVEGEIQKHMMKAEGELQKHMNTIKPEEIRIGNYLLLMKNRLAEGGFGFIDLVTDASTKTDYCLKRCNVNHTSTLEIVKKEIHLLQLFTSPYIVQVLGTDFIQTKNGREALILLEYCPGGHLLERLLQRQGKYIHEHTIFKFFSQLLQAVSILHNNDPYVVHRDLKLENVLFASDGNLKLCDFGSCVIGTVSIKTSTERTEAESQINKETTPIYRSPEMVNLYMREELTEKTDIWALGCIFYAMCYLKLPFQEGGTIAILNDKINYPSIEGVSESCIVYMKHMLDFDPEARPNVNELLSMSNSILSGGPLPPYTISKEAELRRTARLAAALQKSVPKPVAKNTGPVIPARSHVQTSTSSAAARRLAAMKGVEVNALPDMSAAVVFDTSFDTQPPTTSSPSHSHLIHTAINNNSKLLTSDNLFEDTTHHTSQSHDVFGSFGSDTSTSHTASAGFDSFGTTQHTLSVGDPFMSFSSEEHSRPHQTSSIGFDEFSSNSTTPAVTSFDDPFASFTAGPSAVKGGSTGFEDIPVASQSPKGDFSGFFDDTFASQADSDPFGTVTSPSNPHSASQPSTDLLGDDFTNAEFYPPVNISPAASRSSSRPPSSNVKASLLTAPVQVDFLNLDMTESTGDLLDMPMPTTSKTSEVLSLFDHAESDPFSQSKHASATVMKSPSSRGMNISSGTLQDTKTFDPLDSLKML